MTQQERYDDAMFDFSRGEYDAAIAKLTALLAEDPAYFDAQLSLGVAYYRKGDFATAIIEGHRAEKLRPKELLVHTNLSLFYMKAGNRAVFFTLEYAEKDVLDRLRAIGRRGAGASPGTGAAAHPDGGDGARHLGQRRHQSLESGDGEHARQGLSHRRLLRPGHRRHPPARRPTRGRRHPGRPHAAGTTRRGLARCRSRGRTRGTVLPGPGFTDFPVSHDNIRNGSTSGF